MAYMTYNDLLDILHEMTPKPSLVVLTRWDSMGIQDSMPYLQLEYYKTIVGIPLAIADVERSFTVNFDLTISFL